jgi:hypothetical protein
MDGPVMTGARQNKVWLVWHVPRSVQRSIAGVHPAMPVIHDPSRWVPGLQKLVEWGVAIARRTGTGTTSIQPIAHPRSPLVWGLPLDVFRPPPPPLGSEACH